MKQREKASAWALRGGRVTSALLTALLVILFSSTSADAVLDKGMTEHTLENGLTVIIVEDHWHPLVALEVCYRVGSRDDALGKPGLSHVLEHLTFRGRDSLSTEGATQSVRAHATTSHDTTCYSSSMSRAELKATLASEAQRMRALQASGEDLAHEKTIVARERRQLVEGDTWRNLLEEVDNAAYRLHPYRFPTAGWPETLAQITLDDVRAQFTTYYTPANAVVVVVGDVQRQELFAMIQALFGAVPARTRPTPTPFIEPPQDGERRLLLAPHGAPRLVAAYRTPPFRNPDQAALAVMTAIVAGSDDAKLSARLYSQHLADDVGIEYNPFVLDAGLLYIKATLGPRVDVPRTAEAVDDVLWRLREGELAPGELATAKKRLLLDFYQEQDLSAQAARLAQYALRGALSYAPRYVDDIQAVTAADVQRVLTTYFSPDHRVVAVTGMAHQTHERARTGAHR